MVEGIFVLVKVNRILEFLLALQYMIILKCLEENIVYAFGFLLWFIFFYKNLTMKTDNLVYTSADTFTFFYKYFS